MEKKKSVLKSLAVWCLLPALALALTGCAAQYYNPGPQAAEVTVNLEATFNPGSKPWPPKTSTYWSRTPVNWDWGLYLLDAKGGLAPLGPVSGERLKAIQAHQLKRNTTFSAPAGTVKLRLLASAWQHRMQGEGISLVTLAKYSQDYDLNLTPGAKETINAKFGM